MDESTKIALTSMILGFLLGFASVLIATKII